MTKHDPGLVYEYIISYKQAHDGNSPSVSDISAACGIPSTSNVNAILLALKADGVIDWTENTPRSIRVIGGKWSPPEVE